MNWLVFLVGILVGLVIEWFFDWFYWRRKRIAWAETEANLRADAATARTETDSLRAEMTTARAETDSLRAEVATSRAETDSLRADAVTAQEEANSLRAELAASEDRALRLTMLEEPHDDLTIIEGIGNKTADLLDGHDIRTFAVLAETDVERLRAILNEGGRGFRLSDPSTWPRQARLAANRDWVRLQELKQQLAGGVRKPPQPKPIPKDDLTIIEGIGDKIAELLNQNGIYTFPQLAGASEEQLRAILHQAGPSFQLADPHSWPRQAQLAADRDWVALQTVKQQLTGGVRRSARGEPGAENA